MNKFPRYTAKSAGSLMQAALKEMGLSSGLNTHKIFSAWDSVSGAQRYTIGRYYRDGKLYITLNSSVVRGQLSFRKDSLRDDINAVLSADELFVRDDKFVSFVRELILK